MATPAAPRRIAATRVQRLNKHQQRTDATRKALLESARRIFARDGFEAARIEDIAASTGHTRGAFYAHFESKEELFFALLEHESQRRVEELRAIFERTVNQQEHLDALREFYVRRTLDPHWVMLTLEFKLFAVRHPRLRARLAATHRRIRASLHMASLNQLLPSAIQGGGKAHESRKVALEALLNGMVLEHAYDPERISKTRVAELLGRLFDAVLES